MASGPRRAWSLSEPKVSEVTTYPLEELVRGQLAGLDASWGEVQSQQ